MECIILSNQEIKNQLGLIYSSIHDFCQFLLLDLPTDIYRLSSGSKKNRSIINYFCHMVNTELFWLFSIQSPTISFANEDMDINEIFNKFQQLQDIYLNLLDQSSTKDLEIIPTEFPKTSDANGNPIFNQKGSFAWILLRLCFHNYGHLSQITAILYSLDVKKTVDKDKNWWNITENFINIGKYLKVD